VILPNTVPEGRNEDMGSEEDENEEKRSSLAAAIMTMGWRQRVPEFEERCSRREIVCRAREMRKSSWLSMGMGRDVKVS
jgi:hypothetical protein